LDTSGHLLASIFKLSFLKVCNNCLKLMKTRIGNNNKQIQLGSMLDTKIIGKDLSWSLSTGNWGVNKNTISRTGVAQVLNRINYTSYLSHIRRISTPLSRNGTTTKPRQLHNSQWGVCCSVESPEGSPVGLVKNMATSCTISNNYPAGNIISLIRGSLEIQPFSPLLYQIFVNGFPIGSLVSIQELYLKLKEYKRTGILPFDVSIILDLKGKELRISCDAGRCCRPIFVVNDNKINTKEISKATTWNELVIQGHVEYIDPLEAEFSLIAETPEDLQNTGKHYTHCEIHPSYILGSNASFIPYSNFNQSPRNVYHVAMSKQAIAIPSHNFQQRMDTTSNVLWYPQRSLVQTNSEKNLHMEEIPMGQNMVVAIMTYGG
jgi:DNA-directed RNA polymerase II subunit RPB2